MCVYIYIYKEKLFMSEDYSCSLFNNNAQLSKTANKLSIDQIFSQHYEEKNMSWCCFNESSA